MIIYRYTTYNLIFYYWVPYLKDPLNDTNDFVNFLFQVLFQTLFYYPHPLWKIFISRLFFMSMIRLSQIYGPRQANLVLIAYASSEGSGEPAHPHSLARTSATRSYKQWVKRNLQTESQIPSPSEWLGMRSQNLSWRNAQRHKFAWRSPNIVVEVVTLCIALSV